MRRAALLASAAVLVAPLATAEVSESVFIVLLRPGLPPQGSGPFFFSGNSQRPYEQVVTNSRTTATLREP
jgi:hypothetical protein